MGHAVADSEVFENGAQLLVALGKQKYDLVLMDIEMPVMNGCDATLRIRAGLDQQQRASSSFSSSTMSSSISSTHLATRPPSLSSQNAWCEHYPTPTPSPSPIPSTAVVKVMHQGSTLHRRTRSDSDLSAAMRPPMDYTILKENYNIPIIAVTSLNKESDCHYYLSIGIDEVVGKPVSRPDLFITLIKRFLEEGRRIAGSHHADATEEEKEEGDNGMNVDVVSPSSVLPVLHPPRRPSHAPLHVSSTPLPHQSFPRTTTPTTSISTSTSVSLLNLTSNPRRSPSPFSLRPSTLPNHHLPICSARSTQRKT
ncbi:hypothetical protein BC829DRAFT_255398 [Chytridium lagenaria]|nr:hypothetical protein BC829DRAFT_255398 [Chytridium lagenaria]